MLYQLSYASPIASPFRSSAGARKPRRSLATNSKIITVDEWPQFGMRPLCGASGARRLRRKDLRLIDLRGLRKELFRPRKQCLRYVSRQVGIAAVLIGKRIEDPILRGPIFRAYQVVVPASCTASGWADFRKASTSASLPGFASSCAQSRELVHGCTSSGG